MTLIASLLLTLAAVATLCLMPAVRAVQRLTGPDAAGAELTFLFLCAPRWLATAAVLCVLIARGNFGWIPGGVVVEATAVLLTHTLAGLVCGGCLVVVRERLRWVTVGLWVFAVAIPALLIAYATAALATGATPPIPLVVAVATMPALTLLGVAVGYRIYRSFERGSGVVARPTEPAPALADARLAAPAPERDERPSANHATQRRRAG